MDSKTYKYTEIPGYDELRLLYETSPEEIDIIRHELSEQLINSAPEENRPSLRGVMFKINGVLRTSKNSVHACVLLNSIMMDSFFEMHEAITNLKRARVGLADEKSHKTATIIAFPKQ